MQISVIVLREKNITDFSKARNEALKKARREWVLFVDKDETVTDPLASEIKDLKDPVYNGYYIKRKIYFLGKYAGRDKVLRLARKDSGKWVRAVHETWDVRGKTRTLNNYLIHNTADNLSEFIGKINFYSDLHARENLKEGKKSKVYKIIFLPIFKFFVYFYKSRNFVFSLMLSFHSFLSWSKLWILQKRKNYK